MILPEDLFVVDQPQDAWRSLEEQSSEARLKRLDIVGQLSLEEQDTGSRQKLVERVIARLHTEGQPPISRSVVHDSIKIFKLFRLGGTEGFGWTRTRMLKLPFRQLRVFAQNPEWSKQHYDEVETLLADAQHSEEAIRVYIQESKRRESGVLEEEAKWETINLRLDAGSAALVRDMLSGARKRCEMVEGDQFSDIPSVADGQAALYVLSAWFIGTEAFQDASGELVEIANSSFVDAVTAQKMKELMNG